MRGCKFYEKTLIAKSHGPEKSLLALPNEIAGAAAIVFSRIKIIKRRLFMMTKSILHS